MKEIELSRKNAQLGDVAYNWVKRKHVKIKDESTLSEVKSSFGDRTYSRTIFRKVP